MFILSCCKMNCEWDNVKNCPETAEVSFLKPNHRNRVFGFWIMRSVWFGFQKTDVWNFFRIPHTPVCDVCNALYTITVYVSLEVTVFLLTYSWSYLDLLTCFRMFIAYSNVCFAKFEVLKPFRCKLWHISCLSIFWPWPVELEIASPVVHATSIFLQYFKLQIDRWGVICYLLILTYKCCVSFILWGQYFHKVWRLCGHPYISYVVVPVWAVCEPRHWVLDL